MNSNSSKQTKVRLAIIVVLVLLLGGAGFRLLVIKDLTNYYSAREAFDEDYSKLGVMNIKSSGQDLSKTAASAKKCFDQITWVVAHHPNEGLISNFFKKVLANDLLGLNGTDKLIDEFIKTYPSSPGVSWIYFFKGDKETRKANFSDAEAYFLKTIETHDKLPFFQKAIMKPSALQASAYFNIAFCRMSMGQTLEAENGFKMALQRMPRSDYYPAFKARVKGRIAEIRLISGNDEEARAIVKELRNYRNDETGMAELTKNLKELDPIVFKTEFFRLCDIIASRLEAALDTPADQRDMKKIINHNWRLVSLEKDAGEGDTPLQDAAESAQKVLSGEAK